MSHVLPPPRILLVGIHLGWATRKDPKSEWFAKKNRESNSITINPETASHMAEKSSLGCPSLPLSSPGGSFPVKSLLLSACVSPQTIHFPLLDKDPLWALEEVPLPAPPQRSLCSRVKSPRWEAYALELHSSPYLPQLEKSPGSSEDPAHPRIKLKKIFLMLMLN